MPFILYLRDIRWINYAFPVLWRNANEDHIESTSSHSIVVGILALHIESDVVVEVRLNDVIVQMHTCNICSVIRLSSIFCKVHILTELGDNPAIGVGRETFIVKSLESCKEVDEGAILEHKPVIRVERGDHRICGARLSHIISIATSRTFVCASDTSKLLKVLWLALRAISWGVFARDTKFMAWLALLVFVLIVTLWAAVDLYAPLLCLNQL